jgi:hypothetical protein
VTLEKIVSMRWLAAALPALLAACAGQLDLLDRPDRVWASPRRIDTVASCVVRVLNERGRSESNLSQSRVYARHVIEPGKVYEVRADTSRMVTAEEAVVRLEKVGDEITRLSLFVKSPWKKEMIRILKPCGDRS